MDEAKYAPGKLHYLVAVRNWEWLNSELMIWYWVNIQLVIRLPGGTENGYRRLEINSEIFQPSHVLTSDVYFFFIPFPPDRFIYSSRQAVDLSISLLFI